jgi:hypothetical protein
MHGILAALERWSIERISDWYVRLPWLCGFNYLPRTAVNWTELWQRESFDPATIEQELGWARDVGFNTLRTNLQFLVWLHDPAGLRARLERFLGIAARRGLRTLLCLFDDCAFSGREPYLGRQDDPVPGAHNSGAAASPGREVVRDRARWPELERYVCDVVSHFRDDARVLGWDLYNEPGNEAVFTREVGMDPRGRLVEHSIALAEAAFAWARAARPSQPLTSGVWNPVWAEHNARLVELSDVTSFHNYFGMSKLREQVAELRKAGRPLLCTEWLARGLRSVPATHLPYFKEERIGCFHWGLVKGRTQTHLPWPVLEKVVPEGQWHHDLFHADGTAYDAGEIELFHSTMRR